MDMKLRMHSLSFIWLGLAVVSGIATAYLGYRFFSIKNRLLFEAEQQARTETQDASAKLNTFIMMLKPIAQKLADEIGSTPMSKQQMITLLKQSKPVEISGLGVAFLPHAFDPQTKLFAPYYFEKNGKQTLIQVEHEYDYTTKDNEWFYRPMEEGASFGTPYYGAATNTILAEYEVPIYRTDEQGNKQVIGVVYANQSVEHLNHVLDTLFLDQTGYWSIVTQKGTFLSHPQDQLVHTQATLFDLAKQLGNNELVQAAEKIVKGKPTFFEYNNEITGAPSWLVSEPLKGTPWSIIGIFDKSELDIKPTVLRQNLIYPSLTAILLIIFLTFFVFSLFAKKNQSHLWTVTTIISLGLIGQVIWVWYATHRYPDFFKEKVYVVKNKAELHTYLKKETAPMRYGKKADQVMQGHTTVTDFTTSDVEPARNALIYGYQDDRFIPTGIFINNLQFIGANQILMSAYIWQRFTERKHDKIPRGFVLPQATETEITKIARTKDGETETILWEVHAKLNQFLHFDKYPFDTKALRVQLWHRYTKKNIVLVPDLDAYQLINPRSLPGIDNDVYIPGWQVLASNFGYKKINYSSNFGGYSVGPFGIYQSVDKSVVPELYFDVLVSRHIIDTLVSDLLPIAVIAVLLFVILLTSVQQKYAVIGSCATVFFATIFEHLRFRGKIPQAQVVYFESFYFLMYGMILAILVVTLLYQLGFNIWVIKHRDNLIAKLLYWPTLFSVLAVITLWYLY